MLKGMIVALATGGVIDEDLYRALRASLLEIAPRELVPQFIRTRRTQGEIWDHLKGIATGSGSYQARREYLADEFAPLINHLEGSTTHPSDGDISYIISQFDSAHVEAIWRKALERRADDPEGAITAARTLIETVCKHILDAAGVEYGEKDDLPKLYKATSEVLNLAPSQHADKVLKTILQGCHTVVQNLGTLRNKAGDAHGRGRTGYKPQSRHAALAVNLAGTMEMFLIETWDDRNVIN